jgi:hypothetical protein
VCSRFDLRHFGPREKSHFGALSIKYGGGEMGIFYHLLPFRFSGRSVEGRNGTESDT